MLTKVSKVCNIILKAHCGGVLDTQVDQSHHKLLHNVGVTFVSSVLEGVMDNLDGILPLTFLFELVRLFEGLFRSDV